VGAEKLCASDKSWYIYNQEMWLEERERRVCGPLKDHGRVVAWRGKRRIDDGEHCEESWQRLKGRTIMSGETLVEKLDEAVCCRVCHPDVTFLEKVDCKSRVSSNKGVYCYPTVCICDRTFSLRS